MKKLLTVCIQPLVALTFCFIVLCQNPAVAQIQNDDNQKGILPTQISDTRSLSMANTTVADLYGRPSIGINPAIYGLFKDPSFVQFNIHHNWENNLIQYNLTLPTLSSGPHHFTMRLGLINRGADNLPFTSSGSLPPPNLSSYRAEIAYAFAISNHFSLGTLQSVSYTTTSDNEDAQYLNYFADIGLLYAPDGPVSYGLVFRGLGHAANYEIIETGQTTLGSEMAKQALEVGVTLQYPIEERTYLSISFANEKRFGDEGLWYKGGVEITPVPFFNLRGGGMINFEQSEFIPRFGLGINAGAFELHYMNAPKQMIGEQFHQIGLTIQF